MESRTDNSIHAKIHKFLHSDNCFVIGLSYAEKRTGVNRLYLLGGCVALVLVYLVGGYGQGAFVTTAGFIYPAIRSLNVIAGRESQEALNWLSYWLFFSCFSMVETLVVFSGWTSYYLLKFLLLCWCMSPMKWSGRKILKRIIEADSVHRRQQATVMEEQREQQALDDGQYHHLRHDDNDYPAHPIPDSGQNLRDMLGWCWIDQAAPSAPQMKSPEHE